MEIFLLNVVKVCYYIYKDNGCCMKSKVNKVLIGVIVLLVGAMGYLSYRYVVVLNEKPKCDDIVVGLVENLLKMKLSLYIIYWQLLAIIEELINFLRIVKCYLKI